MVITHETLGQRWQRIEQRRRVIGHQQGCLQECSPGASQFELGHQPQTGQQARQIAAFGFLLARRGESYEAAAAERRRDLVKVARSKGEDAKVAIRNVRRRAKEELDRIGKDGEAGEDEVRRAEKELDDLTAAHVASIDEAMKNKETELLDV